VSAGYDFTALWAGGITVSAYPGDSGRHRQTPRRRSTSMWRRRPRLAAAIAGVIVVLAVSSVYFASSGKGSPRHIPSEWHRVGSSLSTNPASYLGLYPNGVPESFGGVTAFVAATGVKPDLVSYYSGWLEPFQSSFSAAAAKEGANPLVQIDPTDINIAAIAAGHYDAYLRSYAAAVRAYRYPVILSFGHEMNGYWYSWGYKQTSPVVFVDAWRHIVALFRALGAENVTWLWTINVIHNRAHVVSPGPWWPGGSYVTWVGIDGYYYNSSSVFASLFGPTIAAVRELTRDPILIAETAAATSAGQPAKIADLFAGIRLYGLLGFVWFDSVHIENWRLDSQAAIAAFRRGARRYEQLPS
jgi:mannan endo-1,4-beta-mannosidase